MTDANAEELLLMLRPFPSHLMRAYRVDRGVGNVRNNDPGMLDEIARAA